LTISTKGGRSSPPRTLLITLLTLMLTLSLQFANVLARNDWIEPSTIPETSKVPKPVDPVFINDGIDTIEIGPPHEWDSWFLEYDLKRDHKVGLMVPRVRLETRP
jgi:hypothetical protein